MRLPWQSESESQSPCPTVQGLELEQQLQSVRESQADGGGGGVVAGSTQQLKLLGAPDGQDVAAIPQIKFPWQSES